MRQIAFAAALAALTTLAACKKTGENEFQVKTPDVDVSTDSTTVRTPDVDVVTDSARVVTPDIDVKKDTSTVAVPKVRVNKP
jgi:hypothetical protein